MLNTVIVCWGSLISNMLRFSNVYLTTCWSAGSAVLCVLPLCCTVVCWISYLVSLRYVWVSMLCECLYHVVSFPFCMGLYDVRVDMWIGLTSICLGLCVVWFSMSISLISVVHGSVCCPSVYVSWFHFRSVWVSMLSDWLCHLFLPPFCMGFYVTWSHICLYGSLCCQSFWIVLLRNEVCLYLKVTLRVWPCETN